MLLEIYNSMLKTAQNEVPSYIDMVFFISKEQSKEFWENPEYKNECQLLFDEWSFNTKTERYYKKLMGISFFIEFQKQ